MSGCSQPVNCIMIGNRVAPPSGPTASPYTVAPTEIFVSLIQNSRITILHFKISGNGGSRFNSIIAHKFQRYCSSLLFIRFFTSDSALTILFSIVDNYELNESTALLLKLVLNKIVCFHMFRSNIRMPI